MTSATLEQPESKDASEKLGVFHLRRFWARQLAALEGEGLPLRKHELQWDRILLDGLGVAIEDTRSYLGKRPAFEEFENWVIGRNQGAIDPLDIERINCVIAGEPYAPELMRRIEEIDGMEPVLTRDDLAYWDEHGYVIVREAVTREQARLTENAVWKHLGMDPDDPASWYSRPIGKGIMTEMYYHPALDANRRSDRIRKAFAQLWQTANLWCTIDRTGFNPPETERFHFPGPRLHWDMSLAPPFDLGTQGILYLNDTPAHQGAFSCVTGFQNSLGSWLGGLAPGADPRQEVHKCQATPIAANAGDLIIWHHMLPHGSSPNTGEFPRLVQYINMYTATSGDDEKPWA